MIDLIGWIGVIVLLPATWFQVVLNFKRKSAEGISTWTFISLTVGLGLLLVVSIVENTPVALIVNYAAGFLGGAVVLLQQHIYREER